MSARVSESMRTKGGPNRAGRRTRWMLRSAPESNADKAERGYNAGRRLTPAEVVAVAAEMGLPIAPPKTFNLGGGR
jgi:hypothetical protein